MKTLDRFESIHIEENTWFISALDTVEAEHWFRERAYKIHRKGKRIFGYIDGEWWRPEDGENFDIGPMGPGGDRED